MNIKQLYGYFYYFFYNIWHKIDMAFGASGPFPTEIKAFVCMFAVEVWLVFAIATYFGYFFNINPRSGVYLFMISTPFIVLFVMNWFIFEKDNRWKNYVKKFNSWPPKRNRVGTWLVIITILVVFFNFLYLFI
jgi:hypothetical protein